MKKYDLILFNGEEILDLRLNLMFNYVDYFVIVEFDENFQKKKKPYYFRINSFNKFKKKIIYKRYKMPTMLSNKSAWHRECYQRNSLIKNINFNDKDMIILSDADEIIEPKKLRYNYNEIERYEMLNFRFYSNYLNFSSPYWFFPLSTTYNVVKNIWLEPLRASARVLKFNNQENIYNQIIQGRKTNLVRNAGWHFSALKMNNKTISEIFKKKLNEYSHTEFKKKILMNTNLADFRFKYGLDVHESHHIWGHVDKKIIKNQYVLKWMNQRKLILEKELSFFKLNLREKKIYNSFIFKKLIRVLNKLIYILFYLKYGIFKN